MTVFSVFAFPQLQLRADCLPQEHLAWVAKTQAFPDLPQHVVGTGMVIGMMMDVWLKSWNLVD